ncbi:MAG TPA: MarR family transcriptional regulator [Candidatus Limnocylindrales bacterium]|jgi:DNA-binding MarR family transcriptional regulator
MGTIRPGVIDLVEDLAFSLVAITTSAIGDASEGLEPTFGQWRLVVLLGRSNEGLRLQDIAAAIGASAPSASRLVRRLQARGLVTVSRDVIDRRGIRVALSANGQRLRRTVVADRRRLLAASLAEIEVSPLLDEGLRELARALAAWR